MKSGIALLLFTLLASSAFAQCPPTVLPFLDSFDSPTLDSCWSWVREDPSHHSLTERPGWMRIWTQFGAPDFWHNGQNFLMRPGPLGNFVVETKLSFAPVHPYHSAGLAIYQQDLAYMHISRVYDNLHGLYFTPEWNGTLPGDSGVRIVNTDTTLFLRIEVVAAESRAFWSEDSIVWNLLGRLAPRAWLANGEFSVGVWAYNGTGGDGASAPTIPADFDYLKINPCLMIDPDSLEYGLLDLGTDSIIQIVLRNLSSQPIPVTNVFCTLPAFSFDTAGLGGQVPPFATYSLSVTFDPGTAGAYSDTLVIVVQHECDTLIRIPLRGEADVILPPVDSLVVQRGPMNGIQLDWAAVMHTISGQPVENVGYIIYGSTSSSGPFVPFGYATTNSYLHPNILNSQATYFYQVTADVAARGARR